MSNLELNLKRLAAVRESIPHFFFPALAAEPRSDEPEEFPEEPVVIPTSILYTYSKPIAWYEFSKAHQSVKRIEKPKNTTVAMKEYLVSLRETAPVEGVWACFVQPCDPVLRRHSSLQHVLSDVVTQASAGEAGLLNFLQQSKGKGLLQSFVENKPETDGAKHNFYYICSYSPVAFSVEKARSRTSVDQKRGSSSIDLENRFSPHRDVYDVVPLLSWALQRRFKKVCANVVHRLQTRAGVVVSNMSLVCRATCSEELVVLWSDSLTLHYANEPGIRYRLTPEGTDAISVKTSIERPLSKIKQLKPTDLFPCALCQCEFSMGLLCRVNIRWLLLALSYMDSGVTGWRETIPPSVALLLPELTRDDFEMLKRTPSRLNECKSVCEECLDRCEVAVSRLSEEKKAAPEWLHVDDVFREGYLHKGPQATTAASVVRVFKAEDPLQRTMKTWLCRKPFVSNEGDTPLYDCSGPVWSAIGFTNGLPERSAEDHVVPNRLIYAGIDGDELMDALRSVPDSSLGKVAAAHLDDTPPPPPSTPHVY